MQKEVKIALVALPIIFFSNLIFGDYFGLTYTFGLFDTIHHYLGGLFVALFMYGYLYEIAESGEIRGIKKWLVIIGATLFVGVVWEFAEWISTQYNGYLQIGDLDDTILDLAADMLGAVSLILLHPFRSRNSQQP